MTRWPIKKKLRAIYALKTPLRALTRSFKENAYFLALRNKLGGRKW